MLVNRYDPTALGKNWKEDRRGDCAEVVEFESDQFNAYETVHDTTTRTGTRHLVGKRHLQRIAAKLTLMIDRSRQEHLRQWQAALGWCIACTAAVGADAALLSALVHCSSSSAVQKPLRFVVG